MMDGVIIPPTAPSAIVRTERAASRKIEWDGTALASCALIVDASVAVQRERSENWNR
jgi:hypothetical protein